MNFSSVKCEVKYAQTQRFYRLGAFPVRDSNFIRPLSFFMHVRCVRIVIVPPLFYRVEQMYYGFSVRKCSAS